MVFELVQRIVVYVLLAAILLAGFSVLMTMLPELLRAVF